MGEFVRLEVDAGIGTIRLDRPKLNALNRQVQQEIRVAAVEASDRDDVAAVIVYGGERVFAAGADIKEMRDLSYAEMAEILGRPEGTLKAQVHRGLAMLRAAAAGTGLEELIA